MAKKSRSARTPWRSVRLSEFDMVAERRAHADGHLVQHLGRGRP